MTSNSDHARKTDTIRSYAVRRVNPFLGVLQVIETGGGRALSANGVVWDIDVRAERGGGWGSLNRHSRKLAYCRYGQWSAGAGLRRWPLASHLDDGPLESQGNTLIECIRERLECLPFRLEDSRELWLFDRTDQLPLALLASVTPGSMLPSPEPQYWVCGMGADGVPGQRRFPAARELEELLRQRAGFNINKHWVARQDDGSGLIEAGNGRVKPAVFPVFLFTEDWPEAGQADLAGKYIEWISPSLLTLQHLDRGARERLEKSLQDQSLSVEHHWQLYPEIIDEQALMAARVQCRIQQAKHGGGAAQ